MELHSFDKVIVVGAGPAGLLTALLLARHNGIKVEVLDAANELDKQPRATHFAPAAVQVLRRAGVIGRIREKGLYMRQVCWRKPNGDYIAGLDLEHLGDYEDRLACLPLNQVSRIILDDLEKEKNATIRWNHKAVGIGQDDKKAWVMVDTADGTRKYEADYIVGCDGANSAVRRSLFGQSFPGHTWEEQIVATNTYYDFDQFGWLDSQFIIDREHWYMAARIQKDGMWRVTYGEVPGLSTEEYRKRLEWKFETMLPGHPKPDQYRVANFSPYKVHQRCSERMRVGRFLLAADAAHLCNPFGGLGLTGGIADVGGLIDCLIGMYNGLAGPEILDKYDEVRRDLYHKIIDPVSSDNIRRMYQDPEKALETDPFLQLLHSIKNDPEKSREFQMGQLAIAHDFKQYYSRQPLNSDPAPIPGAV